MIKPVLLEILQEKVGKKAHDERCEFLCIFLFFPDEMGYHALAADETVFAGHIWMVRLDFQITIVLGFCGNHFVSEHPVENFVKIAVKIAHVLDVSA